MQLDVDVSPPADIKLTTICQQTSLRVSVLSQSYLYGPYSIHKLKDFNWNDFLSSDFLSSVNFGQVTDIQNTMHMSPPCIRTGGLKNGSEIEKYPKTLTTVKVLILCYKPCQKAQLLDITCSILIVWACIYFSVVFLASVHPLHLQGACSSFSVYL